MDTTPQSSFIPKKQTGESRVSHSGGLFPFLANMIFVIALIASVSVFVYAKYLGGRIAKMEQSLSEARVALDPDLISKLVHADKRIIAGNTLIESHISLSHFFEVLQSLTLQDIRFTSFSYAPKQGGGVIVTMKGQARTYQTVALQAKTFQDNENFVDPQFSNLDLDDKGDVIFTFKSALNPKVVSYIASVGASGAVAPISTPVAPTVTGGSGISTSTTTN